MSILSQYIGRLAPSPTGLLHLGNAWSFLWAFVWARAHGGRVFLRMEDIDPERSRHEYALCIKKDLQWLGLLWDGAIVWQSKRQNIYRETLDFLGKNGYIYPCYCTRKELRSLAGAPHMDDNGAPYWGKCRQLSRAERAQKEALGRKPSLRLRCDAPKAMPTAFTDAIRGLHNTTVQECGGDFALQRSDGVIAYQLAVVVDDAAQGVTHVVRGNDILPSTPRQIYLANLLNFPTLQYAHVPLLLDEQGQRLAKRHKSLTLHALRNAGVSPERIIGLFAHLAGLRENMAAVYAQELCKDFSFTHCKHMKKNKDITITHEHMTFLHT